MLGPAVKNRIGRWLSWRKCGESVTQSAIALDEPPLRAELYTVSQLERHAQQIAAVHELRRGGGPDRLLRRLSENERVLIDAYGLIVSAAERGLPVAPAAEWLLDNFYLIEDQIRSTRRLLPRSFVGELPRLGNGSAANYPRVYAIALELIVHTDGRVDAASLEAFIAAYQTVVPLRLGELWALPLMLRLALIENLRRVAGRIAAGRCDRNVATDWAQQMIRTVERNPTDLVMVLADMARANPRLSGAFLAELTRHLQGQNPSFAFAVSWLEHRLSDQGQTIEQLISDDGQAQAAEQVSVGNSITSLRFLAVNDWPGFVAEQSIVEQTLNRDPAGIYPEMDFASRDRCRHAVEAIAKRSPCSEYDVAHRAIQLAQSEFSDGTHERRRHVGYYLIDRGRPALERLVHMKLTASVVLDNFRRSYPLSIYMSFIAGFSFISAWIVWQYFRIAPPTGWCMLLWSIPFLMCAVQLGISVSNWLILLLVRPQALPRMDYREGIPEEHRTLIAVPTMLSSAEAVERLLEGLELRYLANRDANLHFALLTDLEDADQETLPGDAILLQQASEGILRLNQKYLDDRTDLFFLLHRNRRWNADEKVWMGYERKRGKLADLNDALRGATDRFAVVVGDSAVLAGVRYVITLDTDTQLPRDAARRMVEAMAHTLNRPVCDPESRRVVEGYSILQPRVGVSLPSSQRSWFVRLFASDAGVDPYSRVVSDLYQNMFGEGSFVGVSGRLKPARKGRFKTSHYES